MVESKVRQTFTLDGEVVEHLRRVVGSGDMSAFVNRALIAAFERYDTALLKTRLDEYEAELQQIDAKMAELRVAREANLKQRAELVERVECQ